MSLLNLGNGLSTMGASIASTAGTEAIEQQKSDLESQRDILANQLSEGTQLKVAGVQAGYATQAASAKAASDLALVQKTGEVNVDTQQKIAQNAADLTEKLGADPEYLRAQKALNSTDPAKNAQAADAMAQAALANQQTDASKKVMAARQAIIDEQNKPNGGDPATLAKLNTDFSTLLTDPAAAAAMRTAAVANARVNQEAAEQATTALNAATAQLQTFSINDTARIPLQANVDALTSRVKDLNAAADDAISTANSYFGSPGKSGLINTPATGGPKAVGAPLPAKESDLKVNTLYQTAKGPATWNGSQFIPAPAASTP